MFLEAFLKQAGGTVNGKILNAEVEKKGISQYVFRAARRKLGLEKRWVGEMKRCGLLKALYRRIHCPFLSSKKNAVLYN